MPIGKIRGIIYFAALFIPIVLLLALPFGTINFQVGYIIMIPKFFTLIMALRSKALTNNPFNGLYLVALGGFCLWYPICKLLLNDMFYMHGVVTNLFLVFTQCFMLSVSYAEAKKHEEELIRKTDFYRKMSHDMQTPLTVVSTNIQTALRRPEEAQSLLSQSQDVIMQLADTVTDVIRESYENEESS